MQSENSPTHLERAKKAVSWDKNGPIIGNLEVPALKEQMRPLLEPAKIRSQADLDLKQYAFLYKARLNDPDHYADDEYFKNLAEGMR